MLSRKMRGEIREMLEALDEGLVCRSFVRRAAMLQDGMAALSAFRSVFQAGLGAERFAYYEEVLEGLLRALQVLQRTDSEEITALSHELLRWLMDEIGKEPVKKEIVFLPYKASMWDSLESIWQAAIADGENCNAYVVPIPYATLTPEREVKEWHCEKDIFPSYVPVIDYRDIDLEALHPDVIFIHNPFDGGNFVTSVAVEYYSDRLKMYTDKLVYVPYFVSGNFVGQDSRVFSAIINADHVIVESEEIKAQYEADYPGGSPPAGKFLALGSPKYDKVRMGTKAAYPIPAAWQRMIAGKKVVLYNISITAMLKYSDEIHAKLEYVFDFFRRQKDLILWWRPHPLLKDTIDSLRPEIFAAYRAIERRYIDEGWGIYDDSPDVTRAIVWADAYYGDGSSVMHLYQVTGKPILWEHIPFAKDYPYRPWTPMMCYDDSSVWFVTAGNLFSGLYQMELGTGKLICWGEIPSPCQRPFEYGAIAKIREKIVIMPWYFCGGLLEYDIVQKEFKTVPIPGFFWQEGMPAAFSNAFRFNDSLYFIGNANGIIVEYDAAQDKYFFHSDWAAELSVAVEKLNFFWNAGAQAEHLIYLPVAVAEYVLELDLRTMRGRFCTAPERKPLRALSYDGESLWGVPIRGNQVVRWWPDMGRTAVYDLPVSRDGQYPFLNSVSIEGRQLFFPLEQEKFFSVDKASGAVQRESFWEGKYEMEARWSNYPIFLQQVSGSPLKWLIYLCQHQVLLEKDFDHEMREHRVSLSFEESAQEYMAAQAREKNMINYEMYGLDLRYFCELVKKIETPLIKMDGTAGERIYHQIIGEAFA